METKIKELTELLLEKNDKLTFEKARAWIELLWSDFESSYARAGYEYKGAAVTEMVIKKYFEQLRKDKYEGILNPISERIDTDVLTYQLPGGMLSNLVSQLEMQDALDRYEDVLIEMPKVRKDLGYPPLVTPTSQIVGTQAVLNVLEGERYKRVTNEVKDYLKGYYGKPPAPINEELAKEIIGDEEIIECRPANTNRMCKTRPGSYFLSLQSGIERCNFV